MTYDPLFLKRDEPPFFKASMFDYLDAPLITRSMYEAIRMSDPFFGLPADLKKIAKEIAGKRAELIVGADGKVESWRVLAAPVTVRIPTRDDPFTNYFSTGPGYVDLAYDAGTNKVAVGDRVIVPLGSKDSLVKGTVVSLTSTYRGTLKKIAGKAF